ncbi:hypothetical protein ACFSHQ_24910 [Gemmobacter lanyuensis]
MGDVNTVAVAEHAMMMILAATKRVLRADRAVRDPAFWGGATGSRRPRCGARRCWCWAMVASGAILRVWPRPLA